MIAKDFGDEYVPGAPRKYTVKAKNAQEAHEAIRPTDMTRRPRDVARHLEPEQAKLYELIWNRTIACQMESAELERTTVDILAEAGKRKLDFRATGQVVRFPGFLALYQEGRDDDEDEDSARLPPMKAGEPLTKERIEASQHFTEPPPRYTEATLVKRMEELGIGRPSTYASTLAVLRDRDYVRLEKKRLIPEDKGRLVTAFLEVVLRQVRRLRLHRRPRGEARQGLQQRRSTGKTCCATSGTIFPARSAAPRTCAPTQVLDSLNELLGPHIFPARADGGDPRLCPSCGKGQLSLKLGKFGAFIGCSNYPECSFTRVLSPNGQDGAGADGERPGVRTLGVDPADRRRDHAAQRPLRRLRATGRGREAETLLAAQGALARTTSRWRRRSRCCRCRARWPSTRRSGEPILAGIGRYGSYVQHGKTYANLGKDDDVLEIGANRAIDLIVAKESGAGRGRFGADSGRALGEHPTLGGAVTVKQGRFGAYVNHGKVNATLPKGTDPRVADAGRRRRDARGQGGRRRRGRPRARRASRRRRRSPCAPDASAPTSIGARSTRRSPNRFRPTKSRSARRSR